MGSVKLAVTVQARLEKKYDAAALKQIAEGVRQWIAADKQRGLETVYVAVDDKAAMRKLGAAPLTGRATAAKVKRAIDDLWGRLAPEYLALIGADDVVPYFVVDNPSYEPGGDTDVTVRTDNPYACSQPYRASDRRSYLVPDRVVGRIPDAPHESDPAWLLDALATATTWTSLPRKVYAGAYAICADSWSGAGVQCIKAVGEPANQLMLCPPENDEAATPRKRLKARLHMVKCHGAQLDPNFYGQRGNSYPVALASGTLRPKVSKTTVAAAMCCYGAQLFSPQDPAVQPAGAWPIASAYLRGGAYGLAGSTEIAWVGGEEMACADWIVTGHLKAVLQGASLGRALLESKQGYMAFLGQQGGAPGVEDDKTLIEFVLLGDPSIQPVTAANAPAEARSTRAVAAGRPPSAPVGMEEERVQRRLYRAQLATQIRRALPARTVASRAAVGRAGKLFGLVQDLLRGNSKAFGFSKGRVKVQRLETRFSDVQPATAGPRALRAPARRTAVPKGRETVQYYWSGRKVVAGHVEIRLARVETDAKGQVLRTRVVQSS